MKRNYHSGAQKRTQIAEKTHKLTSFFNKQTRNTTEDDDVEKSSAPKTYTEVQTVLG